MRPNGQASEKMPLISSNNSAGNTATLDRISMELSLNAESEKTPAISGRTLFHDYIRPCLAEMFTTMLFVNVGSLSAVTNNTTASASAHGFALIVLIASIATISGGHINPVVTLGVCIGGGISIIKSLLYMCSQLIGGILGAALTRGSLSYMVTVNGVNITKFEEINGGGHMLATGVTFSAGVLTEASITTLIVFTVLMTATNTDAQYIIHPICIGMSVISGVLAGRDITGGSMNPARSFGPAVVLSDISDRLWENHLVYWIGPITGSVTAAVFYRSIFGRADKRLICKED